MRLSILDLALILPGVGGDDAKAKKDLDRLQGDWPVVSCHVGLSEVTSPEGAHLLSFKGDQMANVWNGKQPSRTSPIKLDPTKSPATIDIVAGELAFLGIYEFDGKRLRICYNQKTRPTRFDANGQADAPRNVLYDLKRE